MSLRATAPAWTFAAALAWTLVDAGTAAAQAGPGTASGPVLAAAVTHVPEPALPEIGALLPPGARSTETTADAGPPAGVRVEYTVDPELEARVRAVLERGHVSLGHVLLMDPASGRLLAYVSTDPVAFPPTRTYPAASLAKVVTTAALLRHAPEAASRACRYDGSPYVLRREDLAEGEQGEHVDTFSHALAISNNQCFARLAVHDVGADAILGEIEELGLREPPGPGHAAGRFSPVESPLDLGNLGSGLAGSFISPLAAVRLAATVADGELVQPRWVARARDAEGHRLALPPTEPPRRVLPRDVARELRQLMVGVTTRGTARRAFLGEDGQPLLGPVQVAGKTGSLNGTDPPGYYQWFIGVAPAEAPRIAIASVVVNGAVWFRSASQIAADVLHELFCQAQDCAEERLDARLAAWRERLRALEEPAAPAVAAAPADAAPAPPSLDELPRPVDVARLDLPRRLRRRPADGEIVLLVDLDPEGGVTDVRILSSNLPDFDDFVSNEVRGWRFTRPTQEGRPVSASARLPIPIHVE